MRKLISTIYLISFYIPYFTVAANSDPTEQTTNNNDQSIQQLQQKHQTIAINKINPNLGSTESSDFASASIKQPYAFQNSVYSKPFSSSYKYATSQQILQPSNPSYQNSFQPIAIQSGPTPVIMQYLPQNQLGNGVQYLQLIPTRPLIVPISPYISQSGGLYRNIAGMQSYPGVTGIGNLNNGHMGRAIIKKEIPNEQNSVGSNSHPLYTPGSLIGGYATNIPNFRNFRANKGMEVIPSPSDLSLNTNEYIPSPNDPPALSRVVRGRP